MNSFLYSSNTPKIPLTCRINHKIMSKPANEHCEWGLEYPHEISNCFACPHFIKEGF